MIIVKGYHQLQKKEELIRLQSKLDELYLNKIYNRGMHKRNLYDPELNGLKMARKIVVISVNQKKQDRK